MRVPWSPDDLRRAGQMCGALALALVYCTALEPRVIFLGLPLSIAWPALHLAAWLESTSQPLAPSSPTGEPEREAPDVERARPAHAPSGASAFAAGEP